MNTTGLLKLRFFIALPIVIALLIVIGNVDAAPYQELEPRKGYVPVYIRYDNTPLSEIHPKLAEAFHEDETNSSSKLESGSLIEMKDEPNTKEIHPNTEGTTTKPPQTATNTPKEADSDIASFDVIKGTDPDIKE